MLDPNTFAYRDAINQAYAHAHLPLPPQPLNIPLPRVVTSMPPSVWVDPTVWSTGDGARISRDVFTRVGPRAPAVTPLFRDDTAPTRAIFLTTDQPIDLDDIEWPGHIPPLMCYEIESVQRVRHYHTLLVFNYYSQSVKALADAIGVPYISATRVKTDVRRTKKYMILQSTRVVVDVTLRREVNGFVDFLRRPGTHADISIETASLGHPGIYNPTLKRKVDWTPVAFTPMYTDETEMEHVHPIDLHVSRVVGEVGSDYKGETFVCIPVDEGDEVTDVPVTVGAWSTYYKDTTPF